MKASTQFLITLLGLIALLLAAPYMQAIAGIDETKAPPGFELIRSENGVELYKKDYKGGSPDYVQVIDLRQGAKVVLLYGTISSSGSGKGAFGGNDPRFVSQSLKSYWQELTAEYDAAFCVTNGQFFFMQESPTRLPFSLKVNGKILSDGYEVKNFPNQKLMLELWEDHARIRTLTKGTLYTSSAPNIVAGLDEEARKRIDHFVGRTFVGVDDRNRDGRAEIVLIFNTLSARQKDAAQVLREFGADQVMMLDGGGSTQLTCDGQNYIASERLVPQALGIVAGPGKDILASSTKPAPTQVAAQATVPDAPAPTNIPEIAQAPIAELNSESSEVAAVQATQTQATLDLDSIAWIPVIILPIGLILFLVIKSRSAGTSD